MNRRFIALILFAAFGYLSFFHFGSETPDTTYLSEDHPDGAALFYRMREYGNPGLNVYQKLWETYSELAAEERLAFEKPSVQNTWVSAGPVNISGRIRAIAIHPDKPDVIYAGSASGGVWKSTDSGNNWYPLTDNLPALPIGALAIDAHNPDRIFAGTGEPVAASTNTHGNATPIYNGIGIFRSDDAGQTWTLLPWPSSSSSIHRIALHPESADTMLVATLSDLWKTTNGGLEWTRVLNGTVTDVYYRPGSPAKAYAALGRDNGASANGVYFSDAGGERYSWRRNPINFPQQDSVGRIALAVTPAAPDKLYAAVAKNRSLLANSEDPNDFLLLMISNDGGETWERKIGAITASFTRGQAWYDLAMGVSPFDPNFIMLGGVDLWRSTNGGLSFAKNSDWTLRTSTPTSPRYVHADQHAIYFKPGSPNTVIAGCDGGIHISTDRGENWALKSNALVTTQYYTARFDNGNPRRLYGGTQDQSNQRQVNPGDDKWMFIGGGDGGPIAVDPTSISILYFVVNGEVRRSTNGGGSSTALTEGLNGGTSGDNRNWRRPVALHPTDRTTLYTASQYMYVMKNAPSASFPTWSIISGNLTRVNSIITDIAFAPTQPDWLYTVSGDGRASLTRNIRAASPLWENISSGLPNRWLSKITVDWDNQETAYIAASGYGTGHVFKTTNAGQNWIDISGDLPDIPAGSVVRSLADENTLFVATDIGVWFTVNGGANWKRFGDGLPNVVVFDMTITPEGILVAGTHGRGMWTTSSIVSTEPLGKANEFTLSQAFPNPVGRGETVIPFTVRAQGRASFKLYDTRGRVVRSFGQQWYAAGNHSFEISANDLESGVYFYALEMNGKRLTKKLTVLR